MLTLSFHYLPSYIRVTKGNVTLWKRSSWCLVNVTCPSVTFICRYRRTKSVSLTNKAFISIDAWLWNLFSNVTVAIDYFSVWHNFKYLSVVFLSFSFWIRKQLCSCLRMVPRCLESVTWRLILSRCRRSYRRRRQALGSDSWCRFVMMDTLIKYQWRHFIGYFLGRYWSSQSQLGQKKRGCGSQDSGSDSQWCKEGGNKEQTCHDRTSSEQEEWR